MEDLIFHSIDLIALSVDGLSKNDLWTQLCKDQNTQSTMDDSLRDCIWEQLKTREELTLLDNEKFQANEEIRKMALGLIDVRLNFFGCRSDICQDFL